MKIMVVAGSAREKSNTRGLAQTIATHLEQLGTDVLFFDVGIHELPIYKGSTETEHPNAVKLTRYAEEADAFFVCTPEYHSGMSGALKNALDFLRGDYFRGKPAMIAAVGGGGKGGINALNDLRTVLRGLYALVLSEQYVTDVVCYNDRCELVHEDSRTKLSDMAQQLVHVTKALGK
ncbi:NADPH-dependent FMN reductase [Aneurinibacillus aneurinilyticus]|uniref:NAD(P)H-dependent oxidoreductase n=2 Tax=Aneurinibacillus aneurinilyticus TaxID=1391 RepID=A0A848CMD9_ANEAE|nr:NAD(P)H-dependent oxidoreductase [Aneurinibacillus aneurinilyticus]ERI05644.1 putative FMN-dependent NADPH-azoreductase [Aneurinibacillus aneurinilyticus ATCC 12856]MED0672806.1 NAD(P)H-dependent oxidoreductase [Aneurinibacillus aneurinilyticus]MED0706220.1 NAD(P)H-dependent oxidoreductase [Aneurinibacillus aneurinilyticus]MED0724174.1 NAD(P)H-dependent oxidoreductase [Aneurinibacillus aneurinilyticus]MED0732218.1 NAD(P)H-dependent oxidoreductase [Aneurinibacillus aneurinilyticus]